MLTKLSYLYVHLLTTFNGTFSGLKQVKDLRGRSYTVNGDDVLLRLSDPYPSQSVIFAKFCTLLKQVNNDLNW